MYNVATRKMHPLRSAFFPEPPGISFEKISREAADDGRWWATGSGQILADKEHPNLPM